MSDTAVIIDDALGYFAYTGTWDDDHGADPLWWHYSNSTYHSTQRADATMTFEWDGTDVELYGAKRSSHGWYSVTVDDQAAVYNTSAAETDIPIQLLYSSTNLTNRHHVLVYTNTQGNGGTGVYAIVDGPSQKTIDFDFVRVTGIPMVPTATATSTLSSATRSASTVSSNFTTTSTSLASLTQSAVTILDGVVGTAYATANSLSAGPNTDPDEMPDLTSGATHIQPFTTLILIMTLLQYMFITH